jgi:hypothetical protein
VEACPECRKEKAALDEARRIASPLRELEQPSAGFDDKILAAARAQAQLEHDGNVGEVIEASGSVRPMGIEAARIDAHGPVKARPAGRQRPRWVVRAALGGSVAAAATLALVVSTTLEQRRNTEKALAARSDDYRIRVQPAAPQAVDAALRDAEAKREQERDAAKAIDAASPPPPPAAPQKSQENLAELRPPARKAPRSATGGAGARIQGSGGDAAPPSAQKPPATASRARNDARAPAQSSKEAAVAMERGDSAGVTKNGAENSRRPAVGPSSSAPVAVASRGLGDAPASGPPPAAERQKIAAAPALSAGGMETNAQQARHAGNYPLAASLYRNAADLRQNDNDPAAAAWNLAHAVECLAAVGQFDEARQVRDELGRRYPAETIPLSAARRALREIDVPAPPAAVKPR